MSRLETISREIFAQVRTTIVLNMRFMDMAVFRLKPAPAPVTLATDGEYLFFHPMWLMKRYRGEANAVTRDYLHVLLHCVFRHPFVNTLVDRRLWDLACDIAVEGLICELDQPHFATRSEVQRRAVTDGLRKVVKPLTAKKLYHHFQTHAPDPAWEQLFRADDHEIWHSPAKAQQMSRQAQSQDQQGNRRQPSGGPGDDDQKAKRPDDPSGGGSGGQGGADDDARDQDHSGQGSGDGQGGADDDARDQDHSGQGSGGQGAPNDDARDRGGSGHGEGAGAGEQRFDPRSGGSGGEEDGPRFDASARQALENEWRDISEHVQMDLETFARQQGLQAGGMQQLLAELNREKYDYEAFLKKFAVMGEVMKINDDEFDYIFYTYGLKLFKNMPLIEPLEYKEVRRVREFVIAIDTSGSTSGELVNRFLTKTYNILMSTESFFSKVNIHIVQCDAQVQEAVKITKREAFEDYLKHMTIRGLGGTDFRPVFAYVDQLVKQREFQHLKGMIYFTDGCGTFPERKPEYTTAFVFVQDEYNNLDVPPWAIRLILEKDEV